MDVAAFCPGVATVLEGFSTIGTGASAISTGISLFGCNLVLNVLGVISIVVGVATVAAGVNQVVCGAIGVNVMKETFHMSDSVYEAVYLGLNVASMVCAITGQIAIGLKGVQCFIGGTLVVTEDGLKPIEEIEVGDKVLAYDEETGEQAYKKVVRLFRNETYEWYHIFVNDEEIVCTGGHPFYSTKYDKFVAAKDLETDGIINRIKVEVLAEPQTTYNFEVEDFHTYYVGENEVLVHNKCDKKINDAKKKVLSNEDVTLDTKDQALKLVNEKFADYPQEMAQARSAKGWHFDSHPINGSVGNIDHINLYNKKLHIRVHITWRT